MSYLRVDSATGAIIDGPTDDAPSPAQPGERLIEVAAGYPDLCAWSPALMGFVYPTPPPLLSRAEFQFLFTQAERIAIRASTDPIVQDYLALVSISDGIRLDHPVIIAGAEYLQGASLITAPRRVAILAGEYPDP